VLIDDEEQDFAGLRAGFVDADRKHQTVPETMPAECCRALGVSQGSAFGRGARAVLRVLAAQERQGA
jgi:hypothetical protein